MGRGTKIVKIEAIDKGKIETIKRDLRRIKVTKVGIIKKVI